MSPPHHELPARAYPPNGEARATRAGSGTGNAVQPVDPAAEVAERQAVDDYYAAFERAFRGDPAALRAQYAEDYLGYLLAARAAAGDGPCLDLGCGPGDWLALLAEYGLRGRGVDGNAALVARARDQGLDVTLADALSWLRACPPGQALAVTAFHVMEHLYLAQRLRLVKEAARVLRPGGLLILETPNPENIWVATHTFYHDPTHTQPLTPRGLEFMVNYHGLETLSVPRLHPYPLEARLPEIDLTSSRLNNITCNGQDFAVIARRPLGQAG